MRRLLFLVVALVLASAVLSYGRRTSVSVRKEQQETARKIERTRRQIDENLSDTRRELRTLQGIEGAMKEKRAEAVRLRRSADAIRAHSRRLADSVAAGEKTLERIRASYTKALLAIRNMRHIGSAEVYVLSSASVSEARSRMRYLRELTKLQSEKAADISAWVQRLQGQRQRLDSLDVVLGRSLDSIAGAEQSLREQKHRSDAIVGSLKRQSRNLNKVLKQEQDRARRLDEELNRIIEEESRRKPGEGSTPTAPADTKLTGSFASNKGRLPSPVDRSAVVVSEFGRHAHDEYAKVVMENNGIDFETAAGAHARAVFPGVVSMVIVMEGYGNVVLLRHGEYLTVYAGIADLKVRKGQKVEVGDVLGAISPDADAPGKARLHFEVRHEKEKLNPSDWLR